MWGRDSHDCASYILHPISELSRLLRYERAGAGGAHVIHRGVYDPSVVYLHVF